MTKSLTISHPKIFFDKIAYLYKNYYVPFAREKNEGVSISSHSVWSIGNRSMAWERGRGEGQLHGPFCSAIPSFLYRKIVMLARGSLGEDKVKYAPEVVRKAIHYRVHPAHSFVVFSAVHS